MVSTHEKIAYGLGDTASNIIFQTVMMYLLLYYTDIVGLDPATVGTMFLAVRLIDAVTDPLMGSIADHTKSRWGRFRPYLLWLAFPFAAISILAFTTPDLPPTERLIYAFSTYTLLMIAYTAINIPYCALGGAMSTDAQERVSIQSYRFVFGMLGGLIVAGGTLPMVEYFGQGDDAKGYQITMTIMSLGGLVMFLYCFFFTKERIHADENAQGSFVDDFKAILKNDQMWVLCGAAVCLLTGQVLRVTLAVYYIKYVLGREDLVTYFMTIGVLGSMLGCALAAPLAKRVEKVKAYISLQLVAAILCAASVFIGSDQVELALIAFVAWKLLMDMATPLLWSKITDTIDYGHWKTDHRVTGMVFSSVVFFIKLGVALGGAIAGWLLTYYGYLADNEQTEATKMGIMLSFTVFPAIGSLAVALIMTRYRIDKQKLNDIQQHIFSREAAT